MSGRGMEPSAGGIVERNEMDSSKDVRDGTEGKDTNPRRVTQSNNTQRHTTNLFFELELFQ